MTSAYLSDGDYLYDGAGGVKTAADPYDALLRRCLDRLRAHRGGFLPDKTFGSELWRLGRQESRGRESAALRYAAEALEPEGVSVLSAAVTDREQGLGVTLICSAAGGETVTLDVTI